MDWIAMKTGIYCGKFMNWKILIKYLKCYQIDLTRK